MDLLSNYWILLSKLLIFGLIGYFIMIFVIYLLTPTKKWDEFPKKCNIRTNCTRVADSNNRGHGLRPIVLENNLENVQSKIIQIINAKPRMKIINEKRGFIHAIDITLFFRFYDDIAIKIFKKGKKTEIWLQSQSRLGYYDLLVNENRIQKLHSEISKLE